MAKAKITEKRWKKELESAIFTKWKTESPYKFNKKSTKPVFSIDTPPPYVNAPVHAGQTTTYILMDMFARYKRMTGHEVLFPLGLDNNGLPIEMAAEKKYKVKLTDIPREQAIKYCKELLQTAGLKSVESFSRLGIGFNTWEKGSDLGNVYETDSPDYRSLTQDTFIDMWNKGLIYEDNRVNNFCPGCQTTLADSEIVYENRPGFFHDIKFKVKETGEEIIIGTTRPELICSLGMIIFNPEDDRYKHLEGKTATSPIYKREVPIKSHPSAEIDKGTGIMMMCSFGDLTDMRFFREQKLNAIIAINKNGTMNSNAGPLEGLKVKLARKKIVELLEEENLLVKKTPTGNHRTPICERSKDAIEFINMPEFYVKQLDFKDKMREMANKVEFYSLKSRQILLNWIDSVSIDWPISRRRFYATEVPLWYCKKCNEVHLPPKGKYYQPWKDKAPFEKCKKCGHKEFVGEIRVLDTWFDSSISPLYILKYSRDQEFFEKNSPCSLRPQGKEIVRTWLYYTLLKCYLLTGKCIFKDAWINYHIIDDKGKKMSKSVGNIIDPLKILDQFGAEPYRLWAAIEGNLEKTDFRCSFERIEGAGKTITKLWNVARFVSMFPKPTGDIELSDIDKFALCELNRLIGVCRDRFEKYDFHNPVVELKHFIWETFASHYLELVKNRAYNDGEKFEVKLQNGALRTLHTCLNVLLKLLAPVLPMLTYKLNMDLNETDIHFEEFPLVDNSDYSVDFNKDELVELNGAIWKAKKDNGLSLKAEVKKLVVHSKFKGIETDLKSAHSVIDLSYGEELIVEV